MSPERPRSSQVQAAPARLNLKDPPSASPVDSKEMKASNDSGVEESVDLPPTFPKLQVKGARTRTRKISTTTSSRHQNVWDRKFNELVSLACFAGAVLYHFLFLSLSQHLLISFIFTLFSLSINSNTAIVMCRKLIHQIPHLGYG